MELIFFIGIVYLVSSWGNAEYDKNQEILQLKSEVKKLTQEIVELKKEKEEFIHSVILHVNKKKKKKDDSKSKKFNQTGFSFYKLFRFT